jgi:WD40 repeat protein
LDEPTAGSDRATIPRRFGHLSFRLTPVRLVALTVAALLAGLYIWGIFSHGDGEPKVEPIKVEWVQVDPPVPSSPENPRPFAGRLPPDEDVWRAYVVSDGGEPRLALESQRLPISTSWTPNSEHLVVSVLSENAARQPLAGVVAVDAASLGVTWERVFPASAGTPLGNINQRVALLQPRAGGSSRPAEAPGSIAGSSLDLYLIERDGLSRRLSGPWSSYQVGPWSPDGQQLLIAAGSPGPQISGARSPWSDYYILTLYEEQADSIGRLDLQPVWSPDGTRIAGVAGSEIVIFDVRKGEATRVDFGASLAPVQSSSGQFPPSVITMVWNESGSHVGYRGAVVEAATGRLTPGVQSGMAATTPSPNGEWAIVAADYAACGPTASVGMPPRPQPVLRNRTFLLEVPSGRTIALLDCEDGSHTFHRWLSDDAVLISGQTCVNECSSPIARLLLARASTGRVELLIEEAGPTRSWAVSPDHKRILVGGTELRLFSSEGVLLRTIAAPEGLAVSAVSWSQDGRSFAYAVGPSMQRIFPSQPAPMPFP